MPLYPPAAAGADARLITAIKTVAQNMTSGVATDITGMALTLAADATYYICISVPYTTVSGTAPTINFGFTGPTSPTLVSLKRRQQTTASADAISTIVSFTTFGLSAAVANTQTFIEGIVRTSAGNGGVLQLRATMGGTIPNVLIPAGANMYAIKVS